LYSVIPAQAGNPGFPTAGARTNLDARFRGHDESSSNMGEQVFTIAVKTLRSEQLLIFLGARASPLRAVAIIGDAGNGVAAVDIEHRPGYIARPVGG